MTTVRKHPEFKIPRSPGARPTSTAYTPDESRGVFGTSADVEALRQRAIAEGRIVERRDNAEPARWPEQTPEPPRRTDEQRRAELERMRTLRPGESSNQSFVAAAEVRIGRTVPALRRGA